MSVNDRMFLSEDELRELTKRIFHGSQARALSHMDIEFRQRPDGSLAVSRAHVESQLGNVQQKEKRKRGPEPRYDLAK